MSDTCYLDKRTILIPCCVEEDMNCYMVLSMDRIRIASAVFVPHKAYVQKEIKYAIDTYDIYPESEISIIPKLDYCQIPFEKL